MKSKIKITLLVSGSIAAYKSAELIRQYVKLGYEVSVAMSESAKEFITPLTLQTLSNKPVASSLFDEKTESEIGHIKLADEADLVVIAPATADLIARIAQGRADCLLTAIVLATKAKVLVCPAMNVNMWQNEVTKENVSLLKEKGFAFVEPSNGELACGWHGEGRLAEIEDIVLQSSLYLEPKVLSSYRVVVTAGPTHEAIDPVRYLSNHSSGYFGYQLAKVCSDLGAQVFLVSGPSHENKPNGVELIRVNTALEMKEEVFRLLKMKANDGLSRQLLVKNAAVSDHRPKLKSEKKLKLSKSESYSLELEPNPDILSEVCQARVQIEKESGLSFRVLGFSAETASGEDLVQIAKEKMFKKSCDYIFANDARQSMGGRMVSGFLISKDEKVQEFQNQSKSQCALNLIKALSKK